MTIKLILHDDMAAELDSGDALGGLQMLHAHAILILSREHLIVSGVHQFHGDVKILTSCEVSAPSLCQNKIKGSF